MSAQQPPAPTPRPKTRPTVDSIVLRPEAAQVIQAASDGYVVLLNRQACILAVRDGMDEVQTIHAERAELLLGAPVGRTRWREFFILFGGALFGAFLQGFTDAVTADPVPRLKTAIYVSFGIFGVALALWGLLKR